ncbi:hypothetical protein RSOLAG22IIIB_05714 [Rhizoctonia solani]|uniref:Cytochrome P450 n=1 Tax=Rhizoctonia solani TaxID=456999 RepID=A0A0K6G810_9AGAM|nr:hypothetical protein RSOLAG22IIIB_05714 [Rhizoctonia solani]
MSFSNVSSFDLLSTLQSFADVKEDWLRYTLSGAFGIMGIFVLSKAWSPKSSISKLAGPTPASAIWGSIPELFDPENGLELQDKLMSAYGSVCRVKGLFGADELWISDPRALQDILIKGHDEFREPNWYTTDLTTQTSTMSTIAHNLVDIITSQIQANGTNIEVVDIFKWVNLVALEIIGQAGMGHSFGVLEGKIPDYLGASRDMFPLMMEMWYLQPFLPAMSRIGPPSLRRFVVEHLTHRPVQAMKNVVDTMNKTAVEIMRRKRAALENGTLDSEVASGQDIMTPLLRQNRVVVPNDQMTDEKILAQVNGLAFAGHDTTSSALSRTISVLSDHQEIQDILRSEIREAYRLHGKNLNYDQLNSLSYSDAVCRETLRLYAPATFVNRVATKDWTVPLQYPARSEDGKITISSIHIPKGTDIRISLRAANRDKQPWGNDAEEFRPSRWLEPLPKSVTDSRIPGIFSSTGMKFSQLEMKSILSTLLSSFKFEPSKDKIKWKNDGIVKPYIQHQDGTTSKVSTMPVQVTILGESE